MYLRTLIDHFKLANISPQIMRSNIVFKLSLLLSSVAFANQDAISQTLDTTPISSVLTLAEPTKTSTTSSSQLPIEFDQYHFEVPLNLSEPSLWNRIRNGYAIPNLDNDLVNYQTEWYSSKITYFQRTLQRGSKYLFHVVEQLEKRGMPSDLALLPFIESSFNPNAISSAKASGLWQFMPATGRDFNLNQSLFKDDRRGVLDSTEAALDYLQKLHRMFGDWQLALAAYNWGEGSVQRAIKKQESLGLPIDFNSLSSLMPNETKNYVPKLQAVKNIIDRPDQFNILLPTLENKPYFTSVIKEKDIDVNIAAQLAELPLNEFKALNPQFNRPVITGSNHNPILLPIENAELFESNIQNWNAPLTTWTFFKVKKTERVESIANRLGHQAALLREANVIKPRLFVKAGSTILVPKSHRSSEDNIPIQIAEDAQLNTVNNDFNNKKITIRVGKKDSLYSLARKYKVSSIEIKEWNNLQKDKLSTGQKLHLFVIAKGKSRKTKLALSKSKYKKTNQSSKINFKTKIRSKS